jgi:hypothetical protein
MATNYYSILLGLPGNTADPDHYTLLGIERFCSDTTQIEAATTARLNRLDQQTLTQDEAKLEACLQMIDRVADARTTLIDPAKRSDYAQQLATQLHIDRPTVQHSARPPAPIDTQRSAAPAPAPQEHTVSAHDSSGRPLLIAAASIALCGIIFISIPEPDPDPAAASPQPTPAAPSASIPNNPSTEPAGTVSQPGVKDKMSERIRGALIDTYGSDHIGLQDGQVVTADLSHATVNELALATLSACPKLYRLKLDTASFYPETIAKLAQLKSLKLLELAGDPADERLIALMEQQRPDLLIHPTLDQRTVARHTRQHRAALAQLTTLLGKNALELNQNGHVVGIVVPDTKRSLSESDWSLFETLPHLAACTIRASQTVRDGQVDLSPLGRLSMLTQLTLKQDVPVPDPEVLELAESLPELQITPEPKSVRLYRAQRLFARHPENAANSRYLLNTYFDARDFIRARRIAAKVQLALEDDITSGELDADKTDVYWQALYTGFFLAHRAWKEAATQSEASANTVSKQIRTLGNYVRETHPSAGPAPWEQKIAAILEQHVQKPSNPTRVTLDELLQENKTDDARTLANQIAQMLEPKVRTKEATAEQTDSYFYAITVRARLWDQKIDRLRAGADSAIARAFINQQEVVQLKAYLAGIEARLGTFGPEPGATELRRIYRKNGGKPTGPKKTVDPPLRTPAEPAATQVISILRTGETFEQLQMGQDRVVLQYHTDGKHAIRMWRLKDPAGMPFERTFVTPLGASMDVVVSPTLTLFAMHDRVGGTVAVHELISGRLSHRVRKVGSKVDANPPFFCDDGSKLFWFEEQTLAVYDVSLKRVARRIPLPGFDRSRSKLAFSFNGRMIAFASNPAKGEAIAMLFDTRTGKNIRRVGLSAKGEVLGIGFNRSGNQLATTIALDTKGTRHLLTWNLGNQKTPLAKTLTYKSVGDLAFSPNGRFVVIQAGATAALRVNRLFDARSGKMLGPLGNGAILGFADDERRVVTYTARNQSLNIWSLPATEK